MKVAHPELTISEIAVQLQRPEKSVQCSLHSARIRMGVPTRGPLPDDAKPLPDKLLAASQTDEVGRTLESQTSTRRVIKALKEVKTEALEKLTANVAFSALESLHRTTEKEWDKTDPKVKAVVAGILIDKRAILRGEPTAIVEVRDHRRLDEVGKALLAEMQRRGITLDKSEYQAQETAPEPQLTSLPADLDG